MLSRVPAGGAEPWLDLMTLLRQLLRPELVSSSVTPWTCSTRVRPRCTDVGWEGRRLLRRTERPRLRMAEAIGSSCHFPSPCNIGQVWGPLTLPWGVLNCICCDFGVWSLFSEEEGHQSDP